MNSPDSPTVTSTGAMLLAFCAMALASGSSTGALAGRRRLPCREGPQACTPSTGPCSISSREKARLALVTRPPSPTDDAMPNGAASNNRVNRRPLLVLRLPKAERSAPRLITAATNPPDTRSDLSPLHDEEPGRDHVPLLTGQRSSSIGWVDSTGRRANDRSSSALSAETMSSQPQRVLARPARTCRANRRASNSGDRWRR